MVEQQGEKHPIKSTPAAPCAEEENIKRYYENRPAVDTGDLEVAVPIERTDRQRAGDAKIDRMGTASTFKLLLEFSIPAVFGVLVQTLYNVIDAVYVGASVGEYGLAATTVANPAMTFMVAVAMLVGVGGNALAAIKLGERKKRVAERVLGNSFVLLVGAGVLAWIVGLLALDPILIASGADEAVLPHARAFMTVIIAGCPLQFIAFGMNNFIRTAGHPNRALGSMLVGTGANIVLGYLFIIVLDGGMMGAGSVSYTHLDVYKRQSSTCSPASARKDAAPKKGAVIEPPYCQVNRRQLQLTWHLYVCLLYTSRCV